MMTDSEIEDVATPEHDPEKPEMSTDAPKHGPSAFSDRSPEHLEKFYELVEEFQAKDIEFHEETGKSPEAGEMQKKQRARTPHRLRYEAQVDVIKRQVGDLEAIREKLGLSQRKMSQLLLVDPSAWSRWSKEGAPPHIYRALEWYMLLTKEAPAQAHSYWLTTAGGRSSDSRSSDYHSLKTETKSLTDQLEQLKSKHKRMMIWLRILSAFLSILAVLYFLKIY